MRTKAVLVAFVVGCLLLSLAGCNNRSLVGTWQRDGGLPTLEFGADGVVTARVEILGQVLNATAQYSQEEETQLTLENLSLEAGGANMGLPTGPINATITWEDNDRIRLSGANLLDGVYVRQ